MAHSAIALETRTDILSSWEIYDRLLEGIAPGTIAGPCLMGTTWTVVDSEAMGLAMTCRGGARCPGRRPSPVGRPVREVAALVRSWDLSQASVGAAAINAYYNAPERVQSWVTRPLEGLRSAGAFTSMVEEVRGRKVAVIGHFPDLEAVKECADLIVLERNPQDDDLPDFAAEYVLPGQDYVFITGTTITNKTLPRLLALSKSAKVVLVGPSVPLTPLWVEWGVASLAGTVVMDRQSIWQSCLEGVDKGIFGAGAWMVDIRPEDVRPPQELGR